MVPTNWSSHHRGQRPLGRGADGCAAAGSARRLPVGARVGRCPGPTCGLPVGHAGDDFDQELADHRAFAGSASTEVSGRSLCIRSMRVRACSRPLRSGQPYAAPVASSRRPLDKPSRSSVSTMPVRVAGRTKQRSATSRWLAARRAGRGSSGPHAGRGEAVVLGEVAPPVLADEVTGDQEQPAEGHVVQSVGKRTRGPVHERS